MLLLIIVGCLLGVIHAEYKDLGCWRNKIPQRVDRLEGTDERLDGENYKLREDAISKCHVVARDQGYTIFAVGNKGQCWAGDENSYQEYGQLKSCPAGGKGRYAVIHVYQIVRSAALPTTAPPPPPTTIPEECGGYLFDKKGTISSPGYPSHYPVNRQCTWVIQAQDNHPIRVKVTGFQLEHHIDCNYDYLEVRNGGSPISPLIGKYCGSDAIKTFSSSSHALFIRFVSDSHETHPGFSLEFDEDNSCYENYGESYNGTMVTTENGVLCQRWDASGPQRVMYKYTNIRNFPETSLYDAGNYCRNPAEDGARPWCYTTDPLTTWDYCDIKHC